MKHRLINEFCGVIEQWASVTRLEAENVVFYAMIHLGAPWFVRAEGAVDDPESPEHRKKTWKEVRGRHTLSQLRDYLTFLAEDLKIFEDFLVIGLAHSIENELNELVVRLFFWTQNR